MCLCFIVYTILFAVGVCIFFVSKYHSFSLYMINNNIYFTICKTPSSSVVYSKFCFLLNSGNQSGNPTKASNIRKIAKLSTPEFVGLRSTPNIYFYSDEFCLSVPLANIPSTIQEERGGSHLGGVALRFDKKWTFDRERSDSYIISTLR